MGLVAFTEQTFVVRYCGLVGSLSSPHNAIRTQNNATRVEEKLGHPANAHHTNMKSIDMPAVCVLDVGSA